MDRMLLSGIAALLFGPCTALFFGFEQVGEVSHPITMSTIFRSSLPEQSKSSSSAEHA
jgi:hypothetical protein